MAYNLFSFGENSSNIASVDLHKQTERFFNNELDSGDLKKDNYV